MGDVAGVRAKLWFPAQRAELGREERGFGCLPRPGPASALEAAQSEQSLFLKQSELRGSKEGFEDRAFRLLTSCRDSVRRG